MARLSKSAWIRTFDRNKYLLLIILASCALIYLLLQELSDLYWQWTSYGYKEVAAVIAESQITPGTKNRQALHIAYRYKVDQQEYTSTTLNYDATGHYKNRLSDRNSKESQRYKETYFPGTHVIAYYNPQHPEVAVLERGILPSEYTDLFWIQFLAALVPGLYFVFAQREGISRDARFLCQDIPHGFRIRQYPGEALRTFFISAMIGTFMAWLLWTTPWFYGSTLAAMGIELAMLSTCTLFTAWSEYINYQKHDIVGNTKYNTLQLPTSVISYESRAPVYLYNIEAIELEYQYKAFAPHLRVYNLHLKMATKGFPVCFLGGTRNSEKALHAAEWLAKKLNLPLEKDDEKRKSPAKQR